MGEQLVLGGMGDAMAECLGEELIGIGQVLFTMAEENTGPTVERRACCLGHDGRLALASLARDEEDLAPIPLSDALGGVRHLRQLGLSAHHTHGGPHGETTWQGDRDSGVSISEWLPNDFDSLDRVGQAVQGQVPK